MEQLVIGKIKFSWNAWYDANKDRLAKKKADKYRNDPVYREAAKKRSKEHNQQKHDIPDDGFNISMNGVAEQLEVSIWVIREWRRKSYFPEPVCRLSRFWFNAKQVALLHELKMFFDKNGVRMAFLKREALDMVVGFVYANWNTN